MINTKHILLTGATSGIGKKVLEHLLNDSTVNVIAVGRDINKLAEFKDSANLITIAYDLANVDSITEVFSKHFEGIKFDGFIHCAGIEETLPLSLYTPQRMQNIFNINFFSAVELLRLIGKKKFSNDNASFILIGSVMSELGEAGKVGYCASKAALLGVVKSLALEFSKRKIRINAISPSIINTPLTERLFNQLDENNINRILDKHPLGFGETEDIANLIDFLLSDKSRYITGQNIKIDGGYSIH